MSLVLGELATQSVVIDRATVYNNMPIKWYVMGQNVDGDGITTLMMHYYNQYSDLRGSILNHEYDAAEPENSSATIQQYGNSDYEKSNILQWLNSEQIQWFQKQHAEDTAPSYSGEAGFLSNFNPRFLSKLQYVEKLNLLKRVHLPGLREIGYTYANETAGVDFGAAYSANGTNCVAETGHDCPIRTTGDHSDYEAYTIYRWGSVQFAWGKANDHNKTLVIPCIYVDASTPMVYDEQSGAYYTNIPAEPIITAQDDIGRKTEAFATVYQVYDENGDNVDVTIKLDNTTIETISNAQQRVDLNLEITEQLFSTLDYGNHVLTIEATDGTYTTTKNIVFIKNSIPTVSMSALPSGLITRPFSVTVNYDNADGEEVTISADIDGVPI